MRPEQVTIVYKLDTFSVELALGGIQSALAEHGVAFYGFKLYGEPLVLTEASACLKKAKRKTFMIAGRDFEFNLSCVRNFRLDFLQIKHEIPHRIPWDRWTSEFIGRQDFVMAWVADTEYEHWQ